MTKKTYIAIDLKSFYASVECVERGLDPLTTNLLVADVSKTEKTICLAVTPSLKAHGISGRARLFEAVQQVKAVNAKRKAMLRGKDFTVTSYDANELKNNPTLAIDYIAAPPRMALYRECSAKVVATYLKYVSIDDLYAYSIDEVFIDATPYLDNHKMNAHDFARMLIQDVLSSSGITATAGIAENMYLCKVALDITAKHIPPDKDGVRIAELDMMTYRRSLWTHRELTDFWMIGSSVIVFAVLLAKSLGFEVEHELFRIHSSYVRNALVWASQGIYSKHEYLERIFFDAILGEDAGTDEPGASANKKYEQIGDYKVKDYKERPHEYKDDMLS